jgi:cytochrome c biogenesis protein CcmG/thiol:disulfide interchange protein DsbE
MHFFLRPNSADLAPGVEVAQWTSLVLVVVAGVGARLTLEGAAGAAPAASRRCTGQPSARLRGSGLNRTRRSRVKERDASDGHAEADPVDRADISDGAAKHAGSRGSVAVDADPGHREVSRTSLSGRLLATAVVAAAGLAIPACGGGGGETEPQRDQSAPSFSSGPGVPKPLAENRTQASEIIDASTEALEAKLADLRGHPVVVNQWGSWCPPCRAEFPFFGESAEAHADEVAFLGVDIQDDRGAAEDFLEEFPVPYPSIYDRDAEAVFSIGWTQVSPTTWFIDEAGEIVHQRPGAYPDREALEADIRRFLLSR